MRLISAFAAGALFAIGLGLAGMLQPENIISFLDFTGAWDPTLMFVMGGATTVYFVGFHVLRGNKPYLAQSYVLPTKTVIDRRLVIGSGMFGVGWGLSGICPGPGLSMLGAGASEGLLFVASLAGGMLLFNAWQWAMTKSPAHAGASESVNPVLAQLAPKRRPAHSE